MALLRVNARVLPLLMLSCITKHAVAQPLGSSANADHATQTNALKKLSMEELLNIEVTSVSKRPEKLSTTASAIRILTQEEFGTPEARGEIERSMEGKMAWHF